MSEPDFRRMGDPLNDRLPPKVRPDRGLIQSADDMSPDQIAAHNATRASGCSHGTFEAAVQVGRMFDSDEAIAAGGDPDSVTVEVRAWCLECGKAVRFEGPIGVSVGPGARPMVSLDGRELRAAGHLGENRTPSITARLTSTSTPGGEG